MSYNEDKVRGGGALRQRARKSDADHLGHRLVQRLAEQDRLRLDAAHAVAEDTEAVDHRGVRVGPNQGVREDERRPVRVGAVGDDASQVLEVDLMDDAGAGRHDAKVVECGLGPAEELIPLAVALELTGDIEGQRVGRAVAIDLDRMIDHEIGRDQRVHARRVAPQFGHRVSHRGQVHDRRHAGEVLHDDPGRHERDLGLGCGRDARLPRSQGNDIGLSHDAASGVPEHILEQDLYRYRQLPQLEPGHGTTGRERRQTVEPRQPRTKGPSGAKWIASTHGRSFAFSRSLRRAETEAPPSTRRDLEPSMLGFGA